jgi:acyl dehydratase
MTPEPDTVGYAFERRIVWTEADIAAFATLAGDVNPLHHDPAFAATSRFGGIIASGSHTVAVLLAMCGAQATAEYPGVGLQFDFRLLGAARPNEEMLFRWEVVSSEPSLKPRGTVVRLRGSITGPGDRPIVAATATTLFFDRTPPR